MIKLDDIKEPSDIKGLDNQGLEELASAIRDKLVNVAAKIGGHLASNLGVVELTLALHSVFNSPQDKIIWDVGHQSYTHKMLTGRVKEIDTVRQLGGLSGFPKREESPHDSFNTGHSSTSLSAALGMAIARDAACEDHHVIAVIGDGSLSGGMALEAMNNIGHLQKRVIIILNDNEMSIAPNVGALSGYLGRLRSDPTYSRLRDDLELLIKRIPAVGDRVVKAMERVKGSLKYLVLPGMFFEELGLTYMGPVDGHNIGELRQYMQRAQTIDKPILMHVLTKKGKGYVPAENKPDRFHGIGPFEPNTGLELKKTKAPSYTKIFSNKLCELAAEDKKVVAITAAMPNGTGLDKFADKFPERFYDVGIAEQHAVTLGAGLAAGGLKPVVAIYSTFLQRAYDQIVHDVCLQDLPVILAIDRAGIVGDDGETHQGVFDISFLRPVPNLVFLAPRDGETLREMLSFACLHKGPSALRYPRGSVPAIPLTREAPLALGESEDIIKGEDLCIFAVGNMVWPAYHAAMALQQKNIGCRVVDLRFIKPLDYKKIRSVAQKGIPIVTVEENVLAGGVGSAISEFLAREKLLVPILNIGLPDEFIRHGAADKVREIYGLTATGLAKQIFAFSQSWPKKDKSKAEWGGHEKKIRSAAGGQGSYFNQD